MAEYNPDDYEVVADQPAMTTGQYLGQRALRGIAAPLSAAAGPGMGFAIGATGFAPLAMGTPAANPTAEEVTTAADKARQAMGMRTGPLPQQGMFTSLIGAGLEEGLNPYNYLIPGGSRFTTAVTPAATAVSSELGGQIGQAYTGTEGGRTIGTLVGGLVNPAVLAEAGLNQITAGKTLNPDKLNALAKEFGDQKAALMIASAYTADPNLKAKLLRAAELEAATGVKIPLLAAAEGSNVLMQTARSLAARDLKFQSEYARLEQEAATQLAARQGRVFGSISEAKMANALGAPTKVAPAVERRARTVQEQLGDLGLAFERSEFQEVGNKLRNLVTAKETQVRKELGGKYDAVINNAETQGYKVSSQETGTLFDFVNQSQNDDIFKRFPTLYPLIKAKFRPTQTEAGSMIDPVTGQPFIAASREFPEASMKDLDSLKRAVNLSMRNASEEQLPTLVELKKQVGAVIDNMPEGLGDAYRAVDKEFYSRIGIPYGAKTVQDVKYKDFVEQSIPAITKNRTALTDYLASVDRNDAIPLIQDAFFADATRYGVVKDGVLDAKKLSRYMEVNKDTLAAVPEVREALKNISGEGLELTATLGKLTDLKKIQDSQDSAKIFQRFNSSGLDGVASQFLTSPDFRKQFLSPGGAGTNQPAINTLRAKLVESALSSNDPLRYIQDNKNAYDQIFALKSKEGGSTQVYVKALNDLAETASKLETKLFVNTPLKTVQRTGLEEATGVSPAGAVSVLRDRIAGPVYKAINLGSRFFVNKADAATKEELGRFLSDPDAVRKVSAALKQLDGLDLTDTSARAVKLANDLGGGIAHTLARRGVVVGGIATEQQPEKTQAPMEYNPSEYEIVQ
jgi:hypothetical protein